MIATTPSGTRTRLMRRPFGPHPAVEHLAHRVGAARRPGAGRRPSPRCGAASSRRRSTTVGADAAGLGPLDVVGVGREDLGGPVDEQVGGARAARRPSPRSGSWPAPVTRPWPAGRARRWCGSGIRRSYRPRVHLSPARPLQDSRRMIADAGLEQAVDLFLETLTPVGRPPLAGQVEGVDADKLAGDVVHEAFNLTRRVHRLRRHPHRRRAVGADRCCSGPRSARPRCGPAPADLRRSGPGGRPARRGSTQPSVMFDLLARYDRREGTTHAADLLRPRMAIAFAVAATRRRTRPRPSSGRSSASGPPLPRGPARRPATSRSPASRGTATGRRRDGAGRPRRARAAAGPPARGALAELDDLVGLDGVKAEVKLVDRPDPGAEPPPRARPAGARPEPPPRLHRQPRHRQDHGRPPARPDLPDPRRRREGPPGRDRPLAARRRLRRPDRHPGARRSSTGPTAGCCSSTRRTRSPGAAAPEPTSGRRRSTRS